MRYPNLAKKGIKSLILATPVRLDRKDLTIKGMPNKVLKFSKALKNFRFLAHQIDPSKIAEVVYKTDIIFLPSNRIRSGTPYIRKNKF